MRSRHIGIRRIAILALILLIGVVAKVLFYFYRNPPFIGGTTAAVEITPDVPPRTHGSVIWLEGNHNDRWFQYPGLVAQELFRQAVLVAAREELGLQTRDESLREWRGNSPPGDTLETDFHDNEVGLRFTRQNRIYVRWRHDYSAGQWPDKLATLVDLTEKMSRGDFVTALRKDGWSGRAISVKANAPAPSDSEALLKEMEELSQFAVLREADTAIRQGGESLPRLGVLVRAYANLGQLTRYHWSMEYAVYTARSLLYAQRMVVNHPDSAFALWHRAYARAMAGMQGGALDDLKAADQLKGENPPQWVALLEPFCKYQTGKLVNLATADPKLSTLGMYLAFLSVEQSGSQGATMNIAQAAFTLNPQCLRLVDAMCDQTGPGMLNELTQTGPTVFSQTLGSKLEKMPFLPQSLIDQIEQAKRPGGNPHAREEICQKLIDDGSPQRDKIEPSWAALGRLIQETTFAHVQRMANLIALQWGVDASDYVQSVQSLIADHPYRFVIDAYGIRHSADMATLRRTAKAPDLLIKHITLRQAPLYQLQYYVQSDGPDTAQSYWHSMEENSDCSSFDLEYILKYNQGQESNPYIVKLLQHLRDVSPESPMLVAEDIRGHWDASKAAGWEADHGDYPAVAMALGQKYTALHKWSDAERCLRKYIAVSPDYYGYEALAKVYKTQKMDDRWLATLNEYLTSGQDYGLQDANVQVEIAKYFMNKRDFKSAVPYADAAAQTASAFGLLCDADAHTGIGDWKTAEDLIVNEMNHYSDSPFRWFAWCSRTGHGDIAAARQAWINYFNNKGDNLSDDDLIDFACLQMSCGNNTEALALFRRRMKQWPGPNSGLHIAIIDDELHDTAGRDAVLSRIQTLPERNKPLGRLAALFRDTIKSGPTAAPNPATVEAILKDASASERVAICALTAQYLQDRGQTVPAVGYLKRCVDGKEYAVDRPWVDIELRQNGQDPWALEQAMIGPDSWQ